MNETQISRVTSNPTAKIVADPEANSVGLSTEELFSVKGKVCLVTGSSKGIGRMIAQGFVANGAKVYICSRKSDLCDEYARELNVKYPNAGTAVSFPGDLSSVEGVKKLADDLKLKESKLDVLINNAGATWGAEYTEFPDTAWQKVMDLNVRSVFNLTQQLTPLLLNAQKPSNPARVINIASVAGVIPGMVHGPNAAWSYGPSKAALIHLTKMLSKKFGAEKANITVNTVSPGLFPSNMTGHMAIDTSAFALGRVGRTADMVGLMMFLCSPAGSFINGANIVTDGGEQWSSL